MYKLYKNKVLFLKGSYDFGKPFLYKSQPITMLPWRLRTYLLCRRAGIESLPTNSSWYDFACSPYRPYSHQLSTIDFLVQNPRAFCWNEAGTGKTISCLWSYDMLRQENIVKKMLIICPLSTTFAVWGVDLFKMLPQIKNEILIGTKERRLRLLKKNLDIYVINHDGIKVLFAELQNWKPDVIIVDEHTAFKNKKSDRWKALNKLSTNVRNIWMLSGTPTPQAPTDVYAPARIICPDRVGRSFVRFRDLTMQQLSMFKWVPRTDFETIVKDIVTPVIRFSRDECLDLPDVMYQNFEITMSRAQELAFKKLRKDAVMQLNDGLITAVNEGVMRQKLLQCCAGYVYDTEHKTINLNPKARIEALRDLINESARGVLVFMSFKNSLIDIANKLKKEFALRVVNGDTTTAKRTQYFKDFQDGKLKVLMAHPRTMGHGITLTHADTVIWYLVTSDNELYEQANSRIQRIGQTHKMRVIHLISTPLEKQILERLKEKRSMQGLLLEVFGKK